MSTPPMTRLISFRLSEQEYLEVKKMCTDEGARSLSDFVRSAFQTLMNDNGHLDTVLNLKLRRLEQRLDEIQGEVRDVAQMVEGGPARLERIKPPEPISIEETEPRKARAGGAF